MKLLAITIMKYTGYTLVGLSFWLLYMTDLQLDNEGVSPNYLGMAIVAETFVLGLALALVGQRAERSLKSALKHQQSAEEAGRLKESPACGVCGQPRPTGAALCPSCEFPNFTP